ncbi:MAG: restriction endonuclease subunit S [Acidobacteriota bacterium]|nr:restriction endonuclease subunit S [Acidobacteriota bacterium]
MNRALSDWTTERLKNRVRFAYGDSLAAENRNDGDVPVFGSNGPVGFHDKAITSGQTIVIGRKGSFGKVTWSDGACFPIDTTYFVDNTQTKENLRWLCYALENLQLDTVNFDSAVPGLSREIAYSLRLSFPPRHQQERIAAYLDASCEAIDAAVTAKRRQLGILDELRKTVAQQVLSNGLRLGLKLKDSAIESIGLVPTHWDVKQLRYACAVNYGITLQLEQGQSVGDGVRILTVSNLTIDGNLDLADEYYIDSAKLTAEDYLRGGDLLFNWRNGSQYHVGKTAFFDLEGEVTHVSFLLRLRCRHNMDPFFLRTYLSILKDVGFFSGAKDKVNKTFNSTELKRLRVVIPPMDEQKEICREIEKRSEEIKKVGATITRQIETLIAYRKSLIHECVTGQQRVTEADLSTATQRT